MNARGVLIAATVAGLFATGACSKKKSSENTGATAEKVGCMGANSCKGKSACRTAKNSCAGQNGCKGQGWIKTTAEQCKQMGGRVMAENEGM